ncbi:hypothetical protein FOL47_007993 [Perkinsus chesapeaki]|uniref:Uncharacterized protein n=1 Tax=Perkinsus chesapeaki TaxID=330153 RepID=A0A7J6LHT2_PERCH|nr:hypothetical protein FOL47_007993 [Perkinsus chesapeaki]
MDPSTENHQYPAGQFRGAAGFLAAGRALSSRADSAAALPDAETSLLVREREKGRSSERAGNTLPEPWEYYRDEWPRKRLVEKIFPRFVPARVEQEYNVYKHDHGAFLDSLRTAIMVGVERGI